MNSPDEPWKMTTADAPAVADCVADVLGDRDLAGAKKRATALAAGFDKLCFALEPQNTA